MIDGPAFIKFLLTFAMDCANIARAKNMPSHILSYLLHKCCLLGQITFGVCIDQMVAC